MARCSRTASARLRCDFAVEVRTGMAAGCWPAEVPSAAAMRATARSAYSRSSRCAGGCRRSSWASRHIFMETSTGRLLTRGAGDGSWPGPGRWGYRRADRGEDGDLCAGVELVALVHLSGRLVEDL